MDTTSQILVVIVTIVAVSSAAGISRWNARKQWAMAQERRRQEAISRGDLDAASAIAKETMPDWRPKNPRKSLARDLLVIGCGLGVFSALSEISPDESQFAWVVLPLGALGIIMIVTSLVLNPPWRKS